MRGSASKPAWRRHAATLLGALLVTALVVPVAAAPSASAATTIGVNTTADENGAGAGCSLREAITAANTNANFGGCSSGGGTPFTITVPAGTYTLTLGELQVGTTANTNISISGAGAATTIINQTTASSRVFDLDPSVLGNVAVSISGVTISGGLAQAFGGGAILGGGTGDSLNLTNSTISGNGCSGFNSGAGINWSPEGNVTISATTFSGNTCAQAAGAIFYTTVGGSLSITNSTFTGNTSGAAGSAGGALFLGQSTAGTPPTFNVNHSTFTGNQATGAGGIGGAIYLGGGTLTANLNGIVGNSAAFGGGLGVRGGSATAQNDWWGCNGGPNAAGCDTTDNSGGTLTNSPWITLTNTATTPTIVRGGSSTLTASVLQNSSAGSLTAADVSTLIGRPVTWGGATHGTLSSQQTTIQTNGTATAVLTQDGTCANASASATVDSATAPATLTVQCPDLTATKTDNVTGAAVVGQPWTWTTIIANGGTATADFASGNVVYADNLPTGPTYGTVASSNAGVSCSIVTNDLSCTASGALSLAVASTFTVQFTATATSVGTYANPRAAGVCAVDPNSLVTEKSEENNACKDTVVVSKADTTTAITSNLPNPAVVGQSVVVQYAVSVNAPGAGTPTGNVTVSDGTASCTDTVAAGQCTLTFTTAGSKSVTAAYAGDTNFNGSTSSPATSQSINKADTTTTITADNPDPSVVGQSVTIQYSVGVNAPGAGTPTGNVTVTDGTLSCTGTVAAGQCNITFTTPGAHPLTATYVGDSNFNASTSAGEPHTVNAAATTTTITSDNPDPSVVGQSVTVQYSVSVNAPGAGTPTGNVTVSDGSQSCTGTVAAGQCSITFTSAGAKSLTATYAGDGNFNGSTSAAEPHQVNAADTTTTITADNPDPSTSGQAVTVTFTVTANAPGAGTPTGSVTVSDGVDSCTGTVAAGTCNITLSTQGSRTLTATYTGDGNFNSSTSAGEPHGVSGTATTTAITSDTPDPSVTGEPVPVHYTVTPTGGGTPTGNVTVTDGTISCTGTVAAGQCSLTFTSVGAKSLVATYAGEGAFSGSTSAAEAHQVNAADTTTTITADTPDPSVVGQPVPVHYSVAVSAPGAGIPTGNVTVSDGTVSCTGSVAAGECTITFTSAGSKSLTATYAGDTNFNGSTSAGEPHTVNPADTTTIITSDVPDPSDIGVPFVVQYSVTALAPGAGIPTGTVTVSDGVDSCTNSVAAGLCVLALSSAGPKTLTATYSGDANFNGSTGFESHLVNQEAVIVAIVADGPDPSVVGQPVTVSFFVLPSFIGPTPTGNVTVTDGSESCIGTVAAGQCQLTFTTAGAKGLTAFYSGDVNYQPGTSGVESHTVNAAATTTVISSDTPDPSTQGHTVTVQFSVTVNGPGAGTPTGNVTVTDGVDSCTGTVGAGQCDIILGTVGGRVLTAVYAGDSNFAGSTSAPETHTVLPPNTPPTATVTNGSCSAANMASGTVVFTVADADGDPITFTLASNSNTSLVPNAGIVLTGTGGTRTLAVTATGKKSGAATLTFNLSDGKVTVPVVVTVRVGTDGTDNLNGGAGIDLIFGLSGRNTINGNGGNDVLCGGNAADTISGGDGNDVIDGGNGDDVLNGNNGNDILRGSNGSDTLTGGAGADAFSGGPGFDTVTDFSASQGDTKDGTIP